VKWLGARGADVRAADLYGYTPMHRAAKAGRMAVLEWLATNGAAADVLTGDRSVVPSIRSAEQRRLVGGRFTHRRLVGGPSNIDSCARPRGSLLVFSTR
jgi:hypothetical protein